MKVKLSDRVRWGIKTGRVVSLDRVFAYVEPDDGGKVVKVPLDRVRPAPQEQATTGIRREHFCA